MTKEFNKDGVTRTDRWDKYRAKGATGWLTVSLFADLETNRNPDEAPYWLNRNKDGDERPCFRDWFIHLEDMTGNALALKFLGCQEHWDTMLEKSPWFREAVEQWKVELKAIYQERALRKVVEIMEEGSHGQALSAAKFLYEHMMSPEDKETKSKTKRGRPSKAELEGNLKNMTKDMQATEEDWQRITEGLGNA